MTDRCDLSELPKDQCGHCLKGTRTLPDPAENQGGIGGWIEARYHGRCAANSRHLIRPGSQIRSDGEGGWLCANCG